MFQEVKIKALVKLLSGKGSHFNEVEGCIPNLTQVKCHFNVH